MSINKQKKLTAGFSGWLFLLFVAIFSSNAMAAETIYSNKVSDWSIWDNTPAGAKITEYYDNTINQNAVLFKSTGTGNSFELGGGNEATGWNQRSKKQISWKMKYNVNYEVYVRINTTKGYKYLQYTPLNYDKLGSWGIIHHGLNSVSKDGKWHTYTRDLVADLKDGDPSNTLISVNAFYIRGSGSVAAVKMMDGGTASSSSGTTASSSGTSSDWSIWDNTPAGAKITEYYDNTINQNAVLFKSTGTGNSFELGGNNEATGWNEKIKKQISWRMNYNVNYEVYVRINTLKGNKYLKYTPVNYSSLGSGGIIHHGLGAASKDGKWHTYTRDLAADLKKGDPSNTLISVNGFYIRGSGRVADVKMLGSSYGTYRGRIVYADGSAADDLTVSAVGYGWTKSAPSSRDGSFDIQVVPNKSFRLKAYSRTYKRTSSYANRISGIAPGAVYTGK